MIPENINRIIDHTKKQFKNGNRQLPGSFLITGTNGVGKSWILSEVFKAIESEKNIKCIWLPMQITGENLVKTIEDLLQKAKMDELLLIANEKKSNYLFFIENLDRIFDKPVSGTKKPKRAYGTAQQQYAQMQYASELRAFLNQNTGHVALISSCTSNYNWINDYDQPFFNFFNIIKVEPLNPSEIFEYCQSLISIPAINTSEFLIDIFGDNKIRFISILTEGRLIYGRLLAESIERLEVKSSTRKEILQSLLNDYFSIIEHYMWSIIEKMSLDEKRALEKIVLLGNDFTIKDIVDENKNRSRIMKNLTQKKLILPVTLKSGEVRFRVQNTLLIAWLRQKKQYDLQAVLEGARLQ